jgi:dTMP kinase
MLMKYNKGFFITFEGADGSGKTTQINLLYSFLISKGYPCISTREPGGTKVGEKLRCILTDRTLNRFLSVQTEVLLLQTARAQHVHEVIVPALKEGKIVLCDRYADSSIAYQGIARGVGKEIICSLNDFATSGLVPDITILLDLPPQQGLQRADIRENGQRKDRWEEQKMDFHMKVRNAFLDLAKENPGRYRKISVIERTVDEIHQNIVKTIEKEINPKT